MNDPNDTSDIDRAADLNDPAGLQVEREVTETAVVIRARAEIDLRTAPLLAKQLRAAEAIGVAPAPVMVDLRQVGFLKSTGLAALVEPHHRCQALGYAHGSWQHSARSCDRFRSPAWTDPYDRLVSRRRGENHRPVVTVDSTGRGNDSLLLAKCQQGNPIAAACPVRMITTACAAREIRLCWVSGSLHGQAEQPTA
ncbi:MAG: STAS domain-containing protein [Pseudonocardiaceae bacterium]